MWGYRIFLRVVVVSSSVLSFFLVFVGFFLNISYFDFISGFSNHSVGEKSFPNPNEKVASP